MTHLVAHTERWLAWHKGRGLPAFDSVFFGGGTPSIYGEEYRPLFAAFAPSLAADAEITLEANPDDIDEQTLNAWRDLGVNRLSLGVQTFSAHGLTQMHRVHTAQEAVDAITEARKVFPNTNVDLIYGWDGQTADDWEHDLKIVADLGVPHLSLYNLTYEPRTVIGRRAARGRIVPADDERLERFYEVARNQLAEHHFAHEEVSNWSLPGYSCRHNWVYWTGGLYIGIGPGAHGFIPDEHGIGLRYAYPRNERAFSLPNDAELPDDLAPLQTVFGCEQETGRDMDAWIIEMVGSSLRTSRGVDIAAIEMTSGRRFSPNAVITEGIQHGQLRRSSSGRFLVALPAEWFREQYWALAVIESFPA